MLNVQGLRRNVKNVVKNYSDAQVKVREATSNDPWGPSGTLMSEIADLTYNVVAFSEIMQVIWKRLNDHGKNWKHVYKALVLLEYLMKTGSEKVTQQCRENIFAIQTLKDFQYLEESKDQGVNVREKAKQLVALLKDDERLKGERARALKARERFAARAALPKEGAAARPLGSAELSQGSYDEDMLSPTELDHARPQTVGEEELQLQLALAMSREEADQAERLKRNDDLRLQMALTESEEEFKKQPDLPPPASAVEDLLGISLLDQQPPPAAASVDPWGMPVSAPHDMDVWNNSNSLPEQNHNLVTDDPWANVDCPSAFLPANENHKGGVVFDTNGMRKSLSADACAKEGAKGLDALLLSTADLQLDPLSARGRAQQQGNPFQAAKPCPLTINEMRAQSRDPALPTSASMPFQPNNPFM